MMPWVKQDPKKIAIAVTGKVFNHLIEKVELRSVLLNTLLYGQIFSRMTPDDKATLVQ